MRLRGEARRGAGKVRWDEITEDKNTFNDEYPSTDPMNRGVNVTRRNLWLVGWFRRHDTMGSSGWVQGQTFTNTGKFYRYIY